MNIYSHCCYLLLSANFNKYKRYMSQSILNSFTHYRLYALHCVYYVIPLPTKSNIKKLHQTILNLTHVNLNKAFKPVWHSHMEYSILGMNEFNLICKLSIYAASARPCKLTILCHLSKGSLKWKIMVIITVAIIILIKHSTLLHVCQI